MARLATWLLGTGFSVAVLQNVFLLVSWAVQRRGGKFSPVFLPFVGPLCVVLGAALGGSKALAALLLVGDGGNYWLVRFLLEAWKTSRWTRIASFHARRGDREVRIALHRADHFVLVQTRFGREGRMVSQVSQGGAYRPISTGYLLIVTPAHAVQIVREGEAYRIIDPGGDLDGLLARS